MSEEFDLDDVERGLHELFKYAFVTKCHLDDASITPEEMKTLEELDSLEVLENFKDIIVDLLNFKKECKSSDKAELTERNGQFENMIQKLEGEVRNHIRIEHQLKLHIETSQSRQDELERNYEQAQQKTSVLEHSEANLAKENKSLRQEIAEKNKEINALTKEISSIRNKENSIRPVTSLNTFKMQVEQKSHDLNKIQAHELPKPCLNSNKHLPKSADAHQKSQDFSKKPQLNEIQSKAEFTKAHKTQDSNRSSIARKKNTANLAETKPRPRSTRKSMGDAEFGKSYSNIRKENTLHLSENRPKSSAKKTCNTLRGHLRNHSDNKKRNK